MVKFAYLVLLNIIFFPYPFPGSYGLPLFYYFVEQCYSY